MKHFITDINVKTTGASDYTANLTAYIPENEFTAEDRRIRPAVLIIPGGGYEHTSDRESEPIAMKFISEGLCAFVLRYSVAPARFPQALCEAFSAISYIREHAEEWNIDPNKITVCGFSAGGHLSACVGAFWNAPWLDEHMKMDRNMIKPNLLVLSYPVITSGEFAHEGSVNNLLGDNKTQENVELISMEKQVNQDVPPTFIWHTYEDGSVPVNNTVLFAHALLRHNVPVEMHIYRRGGHGLSLGNHMVNQQLKIGEKHMSSDWIDKAIRFIFEEITNE
ncbi:MAG: alpha/beta hydrolase [Cellulosilyticum sp.]|nr:alpha/beta hydrolase [Cellulosilyticum sp.]